MGFLKHVLFWPVTGPNFLAKFALEKVSETVQKELTNDHAVKEDLLVLQMRLELGEIDDAEYVAEEALLMERLRDVRHWREEFGMGTSGGPVRVAGTGPGANELSARPDAAEGGIVGPHGSAAEAGDDDTPKGGGIASPDGASVEISFDWE